MNKLTTSALAAALLSTLLCGCSSSLQFTRAGSDASSRIGIPHPMSMSQYDIALTFQVTQCSDPIGLKISAEVQAPKTIPDMENFFVLDPNSVTGALKTGTVDVTYHPNGSVASLNAKVEDRTAQVIAGVASLGVSLASHWAVPAPFLAQGTDAKPRCSDVVIKALGAVDKHASEAKATALALDQAVAELKTLTDKVERMGASVDEATKRALSKALDSVGANRRANVSAKKVLAATLEVLSFETTLAWPARSGETTRELVIEDAVLWQWIPGGPNDGDRAAGRLYLDLLPLVPTQATQIEQGYGIPIRTPAPATLSICRDAPCRPNGQAKAGDQKFVAGLPVGDPRTDEIAQVGFVTYLPCISRTFSSIECSYALTESGRLKSVGSKTLASTLEGATNSLKGVVDSATEYKKIKSEAELKRLEAQTALDKARKEAFAAAQALQQGPHDTVLQATAAANARADLFNAQRAEKEAEAMLAEILVKPGGKP